jgi:hypothetical protein
LRACWSSGAGVSGSAMQTLAIGLRSSARRDTRTQGLSLRRGPSGAGTVRRTCRLARRVGRFHPRWSPLSQASSNGAVGVPLSGLARLVLWLRLWLGLVGGPVWLLASCRFVVAFEGFGAVNTSGSRTGCPRRICAGSERSRGGSDARLEASRSVPKWADPGAGSQASSVNDASHTQWRRPGDGATRSLAP